MATSVPRGGAVEDTRATAQIGELVSPAELEVEADQQAQTHLQRSARGQGSTPAESVNLATATPAELGIRAIELQARHEALQSELLRSKLQGAPFG
jgi:hypothetical protein